MEKRYLSVKGAMEYTSMGEQGLFEFLTRANIKIYQNGYGGRRYIDKYDIDKAFQKLKGRINYVR